MGFSKTNIEGLLIFEPKVFGDSRGYFFESYNKSLYQEYGLEIEFVQDNESFSKKGVLRGMHYQIPPKAQTKLVRVILGEVLDVVIDIREGSVTYGQYYSVVLSAENKKQLYIPKGFAHGYLTLSEEAIFCYKCDEFYSKEHEAGIMWNDPHVGIDWGISTQDLLLSTKDGMQAEFGDHLKFNL